MRVAGLAAVAFPSPELRFFNPVGGAPPSRVHGEEKQGRDNRFHWNKSNWRTAGASMFRRTTWAVTGSNCLPQMLPKMLAW